MNKIITREIDLSGRKLKLETGKLARQADAAVLASWGDTVVLVTVATQAAQEDLGYFPLSVEFVEKYYAGGRITAQRFIKRETRPSEKAVLSGRAIDRSIRPLFPKDFISEVQVIVTVLSFDATSDPLLLGLIGTSTALSISSVPWAGPIAATIVGGMDNNFVFNPKLSEEGNLNMNLLVASNRQKVVMVEGEMKEVPDEVVLDAIKKAHEYSQPLIGLIEEFSQEAAKPKQPYQQAETADKEVFQKVESVAKEKIETALSDREVTWHEATSDVIKRELNAQFSEALDPAAIGKIFDTVAKEIMHKMVLVKGARADGRAMDELRPIEIATGILPRTHGCAVFQRGDTQVLSVATLGPVSASQLLEGMEGESTRRFMHHYNMSINPFATGEAKRLAAPSRRDIGHGDLAERALKNVLPSEEDFPYAIRVVSEVLAANASTSMASTCAATLALLNAGVPITAPVAGVALGLFSNEEKFQVITDMQAIEDFYGEMDFKITGTLKGVTAVQMDTKLDGLTSEIIEEALCQGRKARAEIIAKISAVAPKASEISQYAPKIAVTHIKPEDIGVLIGPGGKNINAIIAKTGAQVDIEDDGTVMISSVDEESINQALQSVEGMFKQVTPGEEYDGKVVKIASFGAFVEILPGREGLVHISQMAPSRVDSVEDVVSVGQNVHVRVTEVDPSGKIGLSMLFGEDRKPGFEARPETRRNFGRFGDRNQRRDRFDRGRGGRRGGFGR